MQAEAFFQNYVVLTWDNFNVFITYSVRISLKLTTR